MKIVIRKNKHRGKPRLFGLLINKNIISYDVFFDTSCKYDLGNENQDDTNKLFGIGYFPNHHKESARFGWRYNKLTDKIKLLVYCYVKGGRIIRELCEVPFFRWYTLEIVIFKDEYLFVVSDKTQRWNTVANNHVDKFHKKKLGYKLGVYFGGDQTSPHDMTIELKKVK